MPLDADLMFLEAYQAEEHTVYFGEKPTELNVIAFLKDTEKNIVSPPKLKMKTMYYWQVGAVKKSGIETRSPVWMFSTTHTK